MWLGGVFLTIIILNISRTTFSTATNKTRAQWWKRTATSQSPELTICSSIRSQETISGIRLFPVRTNVSGFSRILRYFISSQLRRRWWHRYCLVKRLQSRWWRRGKLSRCCLGRMMGWLHFFLLIPISQFIFGTYVLTQAAAIPEFPTCSPSIFSTMETPNFCFLEMTVLWNFMNLILTRSFNWDLRSSWRKESLQCKQESFLITLQTSSSALLTAER